MRRVLLSTVLIMLAGSARAEDFTGFYAGVNAGYARNHETDRGRSITEPLSPIARPGADLPPSARDAALILRRSGSASTSSQPGR